MAVQRATMIVLPRKIICIPPFIHSLDATTEPSPFAIQNSMDDGTNRYRIQLLIAKKASSASRAANMEMKKITVHLQNGKTFTVIADGLSEANKYVESITLNGKKISKNYIDHAAIMNGGTLVYKMTSKKMHDKH